MDASLSHSLTAPLDSVFEVMPDPVVLVCTASRIRYANGAARRLFRAGDNAASKLLDRRALADLLRGESDVRAVEDALSAVLAGNAETRIVHLNSAIPNRTVHLARIAGDEPTALMLVRDPHAVGSRTGAERGAATLMGATLDALRAHIAILDSDGVIVSANEAWHDFCDLNEGADPQHFIGQRYVDVCRASTGESSEGAAEVASGLQALLDGVQNSFDYEYPCHAPHEQRWFVMQASAFDLDDRRWIVVAHVNVTKRKLAELRASALDTRQQRILEALREGVFTVDRQGRITSANQASEALLGLPPGELIGQPVELMFPSVDGVPLLPRPDQFPAVGECTQSEHDLLTEAGELLPIDLTCVTWEAGPRREPELLVVMRDATVQRARVRKAQELHARLGSHLVNSPLAIVEWDDSGRIMTWSAKAEELLGWTHAEMMGRTLHERRLLHEADHIRVANSLERLLTGEVSRNVIRARTLRRTGDELICDWYNTALLSDTQRPLLIVSLVHDVTEELHTREKLHQTVRQLETSNAELEQYAYVTSHDLQEPLRMVASFCKLLRQRYHGTISDDADELINYALEGVDRMKLLVADLLAYSRVMRGETHFAEVSLEQLCERAIRGAAASIAERNAIVTIGSLPTVRVDGERITQVFQNLIQNAIKFNQSDPPRVEISAKCEHDEWVISVCDNGIGIASQQQERVFAVFQRLHTTREYPGTGIGLAICAKIVYRHSGRIWFEPNPDGGTIFRFTCPGPAR